MSIVQVFARLIVLLPHLFVTSCSESPKSFAEIKGVRIIEDVSYRSSDQGAEPDRHTFDLYLPQTGRDKPPLLVFVHGGFWIHSDDEYGIGRSLAEELASRGVAVALVRYRLGPKREHPGQVRDVVAHLVWGAEFWLDTISRGVNGDASAPEGRPPANALNAPSFDEYIAQSAITRRESLGDQLLQTFHARYAFPSTHQHHYTRP